MGLSYSELVLGDAELRAIGRVAVECSYLEEFLESFLWHLCRLPRSRGSILTERLSLDQQSKMALALVKVNHEGNPGAVAAFEAIHQKFQDLIPKRNLVIHGIWDFDPKVNMLALAAGANMRPGAAIATSRKRGQAKLKITATEVEKIANEIVRARTQLIKWVTQHERAAVRGIKKEA